MVCELYLNKACFLFFKALNDVLLLIGKKSQSFSWPSGSCPLALLPESRLGWRDCVRGMLPLPAAPPLPPPPSHLPSSPGWVLLILPSSDSGSNITSLRRPFLTPCERFPKQVHTLSCASVLHCVPAPWPLPTALTILYVLCSRVLTTMLHKYLWRYEPFALLVLKFMVLGTSLVVHWLRLCALNAGSLGLIPSQGTRSCLLQLKDHARHHEGQRPCMPQLRPGTAKYNN